MKGYYYPSIDSTNEEAKRLLAQGLIDGPSYVLAETQTAGRGTHGRTWVSPPRAGLYLTLIHPASDGALLPLTTDYTLAAGVACAEMLEETTGLIAQLKPVNDVYAEGRKLGGILTESIIQQGQLKALITGIGLNLKHVERDFPEGEQHRAIPVSLEELLPPHQFQRLLWETLLEELMTRVEQWYGRVRLGEHEALRQAYISRQLPGTIFPGGDYAA